MSELHNANSAASVTTYGSPERPRRWERRSSEAQEDADAPVDWRNRVVAFLAFLTSAECHEACHQHAQPDELAAALTRIWFDDLYIPGDSYVDGLKGALCEAQIVEFESCFSDGELESLARFHGFFELRLNFVTNSARGRGFFPENDSWQSILKHASYVLAELDPDPDQIRATLARLARQPERQLLRALRHPAATKKNAGAH